MYVGKPMVPKTNFDDLAGRAAGQLPKPPGISALDKYAEDIDAILSLHEDGYPDRLIVQAAIYAAQALIHAIDQDHAPHRCMPFQKLTQAFADIERGILPDLFAPDDPRNGTPTKDLQIRTISVRAYEVLAKKARELGDFEDPKQWAAKTIADALIDEGIAIDGKLETPHWQIIQNWHANLRYGKIQPPGKNFYDSTKEAMSNLATKEHQSLGHAKSEIVATMMVVLQLFGHVRLIR